MGFRSDYLAHPKHGPLPALLILLTVVTGLVDAVSILALGRVFVANMTGNVVFIAFALAGAPGFSLSASIAALVGFLIGAAAGGRLVGRSLDRGRLLRDSAAIEFILLAAAVITLVAAGSSSTVVRDSVAFLMAIALGVQNASVRSLAVPDFTTTVLTMTLTGIAADIRSGSYAVALRRFLSVLAMFAGAAIGAVLVLHVHAAATIGLAALLVAVVAAGAAYAGRQPAAWQNRA